MQGLKFEHKNSCVNFLPISPPSGQIQSTDLELKIEFKNIKYNNTYQILVISLASPNFEQIGLAFHTKEMIF